MKRLIVLLILSFATVSYGQGPPGIQPGNVNAFTRVGPPPIFTFRQQLGKTMASTWSIQYSDNFPTGDARTALQYAVDIWRFYVSSAQTIRIQANWVDLNDPKALAEASPAYLPRNFPNAPQSNTGYPLALAEMLAGQQFNGDSADIIISVNSAQTNWYFGTDGNTPAGKFDFVTVILHEIAHASVSYLRLTPQLTPTEAGGIFPEGMRATRPSMTLNAFSARSITFRRTTLQTQQATPIHRDHFTPHSQAITSSTTVMLLTRSPVQLSQSYMLLPCGRAVPVYLILMRAGIRPVTSTL